MRAIGRFVKAAVSLVFTILVAAVVVVFALACAAIFVGVPVWLAVSLWQAIL